MEQVQVQVKAALNIVAALADTIRELKEVPSGVLYANVMNQLSLEQYNKAIDLLKGAEMITEQNHLLRWIGP
jgi:hypothetical protein